MISSGASTPPDVPEPKATAQIMRLDDDQAEQHAPTQSSAVSRSSMMS